jgi:hypothetical protein
MGCSDTVKLQPVMGRFTDQPKGALQAAQGNA